MRRLTLITAICAIFALSGCAGLKGNALSCGFDGDSGYVELVNLQPINKGTAQALGDLCGFLYEGDDAE